MIVFEFYRFFLLLSLHSVSTAECQCEKNVWIRRRRVASPRIEIAIFCSIKQFSLTVALLEEFDACRIRWIRAGVLMLMVRTKWQLTSVQISICSAWSNSVFTESRSSSGQWMHYRMQTFREHTRIPTHMSHDLWSARNGNLLLLSDNKQQ